MTTNPALRSTLLAFRAMVRARGPRECLEVAAVRSVVWPTFYDEPEDNRRAREWIWSHASLAALRWWRWASKDTSRYALVFNK